LSANATIKDAQLNRVTGNGVVLVVSQHNFPKPGTDLGRAIMLPALKLSLNGFKLRDHPLLRRNPPNDESSTAVELPTEVGETQEREGFWFSLPTVLPVSGSKPSVVAQCTQVHARCYCCSIRELRERRKHLTMGTANYTSHSLSH
jgi:hypothetical protein